MISILLIFVYDRKIISAREENKSSKRNCGPSLEMESRAKASLNAHCLDLSDRKKSSHSVKLCAKKVHSTPNNDHVDAFFSGIY